MLMGSNPILRVLFFIAFVLVKLIVQSNTNTFFYNISVKMLMKGFFLGNSMRVSDIKLYPYLSGMKKKIIFFNVSWSFFFLQKSLYFFLFLIKRLQSAWIWVIHEDIALNPKLQKPDQYFIFFHRFIKKISKIMLKSESVMPFLNKKRSKIFLKIFYKKKKWTGGDLTNKLNPFFVKKTSRYPDLLFVLKSTSYGEIAREAKILGIPVIGVVNSSMRLIFDFNLIVSNSTSNLNFMFELFLQFLRKFV